ncbi:putative porin [Chitinophaga rhizosphaerae]|uniref:putative porin n=1 Tax=Chitinophaga rhizosphaerae TaxID=1864947 RepID=UPI0013E03D2F|nr:putative porin [Chitinophaga rhizosphaerae]
MRQFSILFLLLVCTGTALRAQFNTGRLPMRGGGGNTSMQRDTTRHDHEPDTLTLRYRFLDEPTDFTIDSSIADFSLNYLGFPATYMTLGNNGNAARNLVFTPRLVPGFDAGFHSYDVYGFNHQNAKFYNTNRPFSELWYLIGAKQEQMINLQHTQNRGEKFNFSFQYRKINSPGFFQNQATNHDTYNVTANYNSQDKRYHLYFSYYLNKINGGENGGLLDNADLKAPEYTDPRLIPVRLGGNNPRLGGLLNTNIAVKSYNQEASILLRQQYDWGHGDTVHVNDTTQYYKFDPVFRVEHTLTYTENTYRFQDGQPDSLYYRTFYNINIPLNNPDTVRTRHRWRIFSNDVSLMQFPMRGNQAHFIRVGAAFEMIKGQFDTSMTARSFNEVSFTNLRLHGEYRNKTRNQKWDIQAKGDLYPVGENAGDYAVSGRLSSHLNETLGRISLMATNVNREPSYVYRYFGTRNKQIWTNSSLNKENITQIQVRADNKKLTYSLTANYFLYTNYTYFKSFTESAQSSGVFNLLQLVAYKRFDVGGFTFDGDAAFQQIAGTAPVQLPTVWARLRVAYTAKLFKNLNLYTGLEGKYNTPYYADDYSPMLSQFVYQDVLQINNKPEVAAFVHFRIKSLSAYVRGENLNSLVWDNNFVSPLYPSNNFGIRVGLRWWFVN